MVNLPLRFDEEQLERAELTVEIAEHYLERYAYLEKHNPDRKYIVRDHFFCEALKHFISTKQGK